MKIEAIMDTIYQFSFAGCEYRYSILNEKGSNRITFHFARKENDIHPYWSKFFIEKDMSKNEPNILFDRFSIAWNDTTHDWQLRHFGAPIEFIRLTR